jgi:acyl-[acyl carrier protein]--UDP-N-acetylglucosamine O-acyltransferase
MIVGRVLVRVSVTVGVNVMVGVRVKVGVNVKVGVRVIVGVSVMVGVSKAVVVSAIVGEKYCVEVAKGFTGTCVIVGNLSITGGEKISITLTMQHMPSKATGKKPRQK